VAIATRIFPPDVGAAAFRLEHLSHALAARGIEVDVLTTRPAGGHAPDPPPGVAVSRWPVLRDATGNVRGYLQYASFDGPLALRLATHRRVDATVSEPPPTTGAVVSAVSRARRQPYAYYAADVWSDGIASTNAPVWLARALRRMEVAVLSRARVVLSTSPAVTTRLVQLGVPEKNVVTVGNGVDVSVFTPDGDRPAPNQRYFVYAGTMSEWQGVDVFVRALARLPVEHDDVRIVVLGTGVDAERLREMASTLVPDRVDFVGLQPPDVAAAWIRGASASLASLRPDGEYQAMTPTKVFAAAACGVPALFAGTGGGADAVRRNDLGIVCAHDERAAAEAMQAMLTDGQARPIRRLVDWAALHASLEAVATSAVDVLASRIPELVRHDSPLQQAH
jgi:glycosyltransferase involved in cell wall biosynthesis